MTTFYNNDNTANPIIVVGNSSANAAYQLVKASFPNSLPNGQPARFGCVRVEIIP